MATKIQLRRDLAASWTSANPTLAQGEPGLEIDTGKIKYGDGTTAWTNLDYASGGSSDVLTDDHAVTITVGNTEYFAIVNRANNNDDGVESSAVAYDSENNLITLHISEVYDGDSYTDILVISKFDDTGAVLWQKQIDQDVDISQAHDLAIDTDDNIIVAVSVDNTGPDSIALIKFTSSGTVVWQKNYVAAGQYSWIELSAMVLSGTDILLAVQYIQDDDDGTPNLGLLMKVSATNGALTWAKSFSFGFDTYLYGLDVTISGDPIVVGRVTGMGASSVVLARFNNTNGAETWSKVLFAFDPDTSYSGGDIVIDSQNNIFISVNSSQTLVHQDGRNTTTTIAHVMKLNSSGVVQWTRRIGPGPCASVATGIDCDSVGNVYLAALTVVQKDPNRDNTAYTDTAKNALAVAKYSTAGAVLWQRYIESDNYSFYHTKDDGANTGSYSSGTNRGRNMSIGLNGKMAIQVTVRNEDPDGWYDNQEYWESITLQIDQDGREMTLGSGNEKFTVKESRIPGKFITVDQDTVTGDISLSDLTSNVTVTTTTRTLSDGELAQQVAKSAPYEYVFGNDGTLSIPNDGDIRLTQTQLGWFSVFGQPNNDGFDIDVRSSCVDTSTGDVYMGGEENFNYRGFVTRYNSQGEVLWSIQLRDDNNNWGTNCYALKIHPTTGNLMALAYYDGGPNSVLLLEIDPDTARVLNSTGFRDLNNNGGTNGYDFDFLSDGKVVVVGQKNDEYQSYSVTSNTSISTTGLLVFNRSDIPGKTITDSFYVAGTDITNRTPVDTVNYYPGLTGNVRQGSGATFNVVANDGDPGVYTANVASGGTNYLAGHKIKILGTSLGGTTPTNDLILTVATVSSGAISTLATPSGTADGGAQTTYSAVSGTNHQTGSGLVFGFYGTAANVYSDHSTLLVNQGNNYVTGDTIVIPGTQLGGTSPANDLTANVDVSAGRVTTFYTFSGNAQTTTWHVRTDAQTPNFGNVSGAWSLQESLNGEAFVYVGTAPGVTFDAVWTKVLGAGDSGDNESYRSVAVDASNNIYTVGSMPARNNAAGADLNDYWCAVVSKFNSAGTHQWTKALNTDINDHYGRRIAVRGSTVVVSHVNDNNGRTVITKLDATGAVKWQRDTVANDGESSVAIDTNGDIYAVLEGFSESQYNQCIKVIRFNTYGEVIWRKILATQIGTNGQSLEDDFQPGRHLHLDETHLYISGRTTAFDNDAKNGFLVKLPKSGDQDGVYGAWTIMMDAYDVDKVHTTEATAFTPNIGTGEFEEWVPDFYTQWWDPSDGDGRYHTLTEIRDRDGGAIEFADGTRQTSSAQMWPQKRISNGADHRLCLDDMGKHIYVTTLSTRIAVPYNNDVPLPVGFTVMIINNSGGTISIDGDGFGTINIIVPGEATATYWDLADQGMATLIKVDSDTWFMTGNVTVD